MKYVKLNLSLGDKLKLLFFGIVQEDKLPTVEVVKVEKVFHRTESPTSTVINNSEDEEKFHVPFFDLSNDDVKSNL